MTKPHDYKADRERLEKMLDDRLSTAAVVLPVPNQAGKEGQRISRIIRDMGDLGE